MFQYGVHLGLGGGEGKWVEEKEVALILEQMETFNGWGLNMSVSKMYFFISEGSAASD